ncbi:MAG: ACP S-malonyltransferase [Litorivicinus sp.]
MSKLAFLFPGQGSQKPGMLLDIAQQYPQIQTTFEQASDALGEDMWAMLREGDAETLSLTANTQPLLLSAGVALWRIWQEKGGEQPEMMAGHSLGEYTALACSGVLSFEDAVRATRFRGQAMQRAVPAGTGAMAAVIGLDDATVIQVCADAAQGEVIEAVNFNAPGQVVIAGAASAVERALPLLKEAGAKRALPLPVSAPFHCALMRPAADELTGFMADIQFNQPVCPIVQNVSVAPETDPETIKRQVLEQTYSPVRWTQTVQYLVSSGFDRSVECGPGAVLAGLAKRIDKAMSTQGLGDLASLEQGLQS